MRVCFILGNLTTDDDGVRYELCLTHKALSPLSSLLSSSLTSELERERDGTAVHEKSPDEEILIKVFYTKLQPSFVLSPQWTVYVDSNLY